MEDTELKEITEKLEKGISDLFDSEKYKSFLKTMSKFHNYSFRNAMLIHLQRPDATYVAGFKAWNKLNRHINKGETGIRIFSPSPYKIKEQIQKRDEYGKVLTDNTGKPITEVIERIIPSYKVTTVFDVSQTSGEELPEIAHQLSGNVKDYETMKTAIIASSPVHIRFDDTRSAANGYYSHSDKEIVVKGILSEQHTLKTCVHEIAHSILHDKDTGTQKDNDLTNRDREVQAESVAYTVCQHFGIDSSDYSFGYIAGWSSDREMEELKKSLDVIRETSNRLITDISKNLELLQPNMDKSENMSIVTPEINKIKPRHHKLAM